MAEATILLRDNKTIAAPAKGEVERKLTVWELLWNDGFVRKSVIIIFLAVAWEVYGTILDNPLLFPTFHDTILTMFEKVRDGTIPDRRANPKGRHRVRRGDLQKLAAPPAHPYDPDADAQDIARLRRKL